MSVIPGGFPAFPGGEFRGFFLTFLLLGALGDGSGGLGIVLVVALLLGQVGMGVVVTQPRPVLVALPADCREKTGKIPVGPRQRREIPNPEASGAAPAPAPGWESRGCSRLTPNRLELGKTTRNS